MSTSSRHTSPDGSLARSGSTAVLRGALLVGIAFVIGVVLLGKAFSEGELNPISDRTETGSPSDGGPTGEEVTTTLPPPTTHPAAQVTVLVLNGGGPGGIARKGADAVKAQDYTAAEPGNAKERVPASVVYFTTDVYRPDAEAVAAVLQIAPAQVLAIPAPPPVDDIKGAHVVVVLGPDANIPG